MELCRGPSTAQREENMLRTGFNHINIQTYIQKR